MKNEMIAIVRSKSDVVQDWTEWFTELETKWDLFTMTAVFKSGSGAMDKGRWDSQYARVIRKLNKRLCRHACDARFGTGDLMLKLPFRSKSVQERCNALAIEKQKRVSEREGNLVTFHELYFHEFDETSWFKDSIDQRSAHHVHGVVGIPKNLTHKAWDVEQNCLNPKLKKDFATMDMVSSVLMEPIRNGELKSWISYISKRKPFYEH